ncbi:hypothetical protein Lepil_1265 [Leptonema illini DSM 21528]|uniref:Uncharacterized protein n=2 Tax=Leptonema illini TaxID=183 RepID=H2CIG3_9LEPT|nr:hypothetical protein Lepil_1265 [Leptonema illini DSM 21528]
MQEIFRITERAASNFELTYSGHRIVAIEAIILLMNDDMPCCGSGIPSKRSDIIIHSIRKDPGTYLTVYECECSKCKRQWTVQLAGGFAEQSYVWEPAED